MKSSGMFSRYFVICLIIVCLSLVCHDAFGQQSGPLPKGTYVDAGEFPSLNAAVAASAGKTLLVGRPMKLTGGLVVPADISMVVVKGGSIIAASPLVLDIKGAFSAGLYRVFSGFRAGEVRFGDGSVKEVYPQWWGPDGSSGIQSALQSFNSVVLPKGVYMIDTQIRIPSNTTLKGMPGAILKRSGRTNYPLSSMVVNEHFSVNPPLRRDTNIVIEGITVDGNRGHQSSMTNGIYIRSATNVRLKDVTVYNCGQQTTVKMGTGILFSNVLNGLIDSCWSYSNDGDGIDLYTKNTNVIVRSCVTYDNRVIGIEVEGRLNGDYKSYRNAGISIEGSVAYHNGSSGHGILVDWSDAVTVTGNIVTATDTWAGAILVVGCNDITITGNSLYANEGYPGSKNPAYGIAVWDHVYGNDGISRNVTISNNVLEENTGGIYLRNVRSSLIEGNSIKRLANTSNGVYIDARCENISVRNNTMRLSGTGSGIAAISGDDGIMVTGNVVENADSGVIFPAAGKYSDIDITGNLLASCKNGIYAFPGVSLARGHITRNIFKGIKDKDIGAAAPVILSSFFVRDNVRDRGISNWNSVGVKPSTGTWEAGDRIMNPRPRIRGKAPDRYVVTGWLCVESGTPGKWVSLISRVGD